MPDLNVLHPRKKRPYDDNYWRFNEPRVYDTYEMIDALKRLGYKRIPKTSNRKMLLLWQAKHYMGYSDFELIDHCKKQGLIVETQPKRREMLRMLMEKDQNRTFHRFLDLPEELQLQVCEHYVAEFQHTFWPSAPPLVQVCRSIRRLSLPVFYGTICPVLGFSYDLGRRLEVDKESIIWMASLAPNVVDSIAQICLSISYDSFFSLECYTLEIILKASRFSPKDNTKQKAKGIRTDYEHLEVEIEKTFIAGYIQRSEAEIQAKQEMRQSCLSPEKDKVGIWVPRQDLIAILEYSLPGKKSLGDLLYFIVRAVDSSRAENEGNRQYEHSYKPQMRRLAECFPPELSNEIFQTIEDATGDGTSNE